MESDNSATLDMARGGLRPWIHHDTGHSPIVYSASASFGNSLIPYNSGRNKAWRLKRVMGLFFV